MTHFHAVIGSVEHKNQRYDTVGDWQVKPDGGLLILVSRLSDERYEFLIAMHEIVEAYLCKRAGISEESVTAFDKDFENKRLAETEAAEPGDDPRSPYHKQHVFASKIERMVADELGINWEAYNAEVESK